MTKRNIMHNSNSRDIDFPEIIFPSLLDTKPAISLEDIFYVEELKQRKFFFIDDINYLTVCDLIRHIFNWNSIDKGLPEDERLPILLYLSSNGGDVSAGMSLVDCIQSSKTPIYAINTGMWYSMGLIIGCVAYKRFGTINSTYLMHDGSVEIYGSTSKANDRSAFNRRIDKRIKELILSRTNMTAREYDKNQRVEYFMFADEAKEKGFIDEILGVDIDIDSII